MGVETRHLAKSARSARHESHDVSDRWLDRSARRMLVEAVERPGSEGGIPRADVCVREGRSAVSFSQRQYQFFRNTFISFLIRMFVSGCLLGAGMRNSVEHTLDTSLRGVSVVRGTSFPRSSSLFLQRVSSNSLRADLPSRRECAKTGRQGHAGRRSSACVTNLNRLPYFVIGRRILGHPGARISRVSHRKGRGISFGPPPGDGPGVRFRRKGGESIRV